MAAFCWLHTAASRPATQPAKVVCIEYPREPGKDEQYAWVCLNKAVAVADAMLGFRSQVRARVEREAQPPSVSLLPEV